MATIVSRPGTAGEATVGRRPYAMLGMATVGFALTFWAWALLSPLGAHFKQTLGLTSFQQALIVAVPVIVGALGRIPVGALTDRYGGRLMFPIISFATIVPVLFLGLVGYRSLPAVLAGGFFLGWRGRRSRWGCRSSARGSGPSAGAWRSASLAWARAEPRSVLSLRSS
jgi:NNP family nitrate/nitrite transporter-like MFS transporter